MCQNVFDRLPGPMSAPRTAGARDRSQIARRRLQTEGICFVRGCFHCVARVAYP